MPLNSHSEKSLAIARTRAGPEVGSLGAKSTDRGLQDPGLCIQSDQLE